MPKTRPPADFDALLRARLDIRPDGCWIWLGAKVRSGYGILRMRMTNRIAYETWVGPIPPGLMVDHICRVKACVNPEHLRLATNKQNQENLSGPKRTNKLGVLGVTYDADRDCYRARVQHNGKTYERNRKTLAEAEQAAISLRNSLFTHNDADRREGVSA